MSEFDKMTNPFDAPITSIDRAAAFFWEHAGWGYNKSLGETPEQGRENGALALARAEEFGRVHNWEVQWVWDGEGDHSYTDHVDTCEQCLVGTADGDVLAQIGCVDDADDNYRRVVAAELMLEAKLNVERHEPTDANQPYPADYPWEENHQNIEETMHSIMVSAARGLMACTGAASVTYSQSWQDEYGNVTRTGDVTVGR